MNIRFLFFKSILALQMVAFPCFFDLTALESSVVRKPLEIEADQVDYNGLNMRLNGNVIIDHEIGHVTANDADISCSYQKGLNYDQVELHGNVHIGLKQGGELTCAKAVLNSNLYLGLFTGNAQQPYVEYQEVLHPKKNEDISLHLQSLTMAIHLVEDSHKEHSSLLNALKDVVAEGEVFLNYNHEFKVKADKATYFVEKELQNSEKKLSIPGILVLQAQDQDEGSCQVTTKQGDHVYAKEIKIDTIRRQLELSHAQGVLIAGQGSVAKVQADVLLWDDLTDTLILKNGVEINQEGLGTLKTNEEVRLYRETAAGHHQLKAIEASGDVFLTYRDASISHTLKCYGPLKVDHQKMETRLYSPADDLGKVQQEKQISFEDNRGKIFADRILIRYSYIDHAIAPTKIVLLGNVRIYNQFKGLEREEPTILQYVLADRVEFSPVTNEMVFNSKPGNRVLFYDKANKLEVSAPQLKITRDRATKKETMQSFGDVRFSFIDQEFAQLRRIFSLDAPQTVNEK